MHHEKTCECGEEILVGGLKGKRALCLRCFRKVAKNPPPSPSDMASELMRSTSGGITTKKGKEVLK